MRGSREERIQEVFSLQASDWDFDILLGIIQGILDHAEDVRLAAMEKLLEIDDFSSIIDPSGLKGAGKWQSQKT